MKKVLVSFGVITCLLICVAAISCKGNNKQANEVKAAQEAVNAWMNLLSENKFAESWEDSAEYFKGVITKEDWAKMMDGAVKPLGKVLSRELQNSNFTTKLPGVPDGEYVVFEFKTTFENKNNATETVTPMKDKDGKWRVAGYYIK